MITRLVAKLRMIPESASIPRRNGERMNEVQAYITAGVLPATVVDSFRSGLATAPIDLPPGYHLEFGGEAAERNDAVGNLLSSVGMLLVLMIATLVMSTCRIGSSFGYSADLCWNDSQ